MKCVEYLKTGSQLGVKDEGCDRGGNSTCRSSKAAEEHSLGQIVHVAQATGCFLFCKQGAIEGMSVTNLHCSAITLPVADEWIGGFTSLMKKTDPSGDHKCSAMTLKRTP